MTGNADFLKKTSSYPSVKFAALNDSVSGTIVGQTPEPIEIDDKYNPGKTKMVMPVNLDTTGNGNEADFVTLWVNKGFMQGAIADALFAAGCTDLEVGGKLAVQWTDEKDTGKGNPAKVYEAKYVPPANSPKKSKLEDLI